MSYIQLKATHSPLRRLILILLASLSLAICYCVLASALNQVLINEVELNPRRTANSAEKVELYNPSNGSIDISSWTISSTGGSAAATRVVSEGMILSPAGYHAVGRDSQQWLDNTYEVIKLRNESSLLIDSAGPFHDGDNDHKTWQLSLNGQDNWVFSSNSLGGANSVSLGSDLELSAQLTLGHPIIIQPEPSLAGNSTVEAAAVIPAIQPTQNLTIAFIDVGQGDSILIILPNTKTLLIDGGDREDSDKVLATLQEHGLRYIDVVLATHPHADHIGGLIDVIKSIEVGQVLDSGQLHTTQTFEDFLDSIETEQIPLKSVREGDSIDLDPIVKIEVLNPPANLPDSAYSEAEFNDNSVVLKLAYGQFSTLLTGDIEEGNEARLVSENSTALDVEVLKAGHHGSRTSSTSHFLNAVTPEVVIISLGIGNTYGHPHQEALDRISAAGTEHLFRTDVDGTITLTANSRSEYSIVTEKSMDTFDVSKFESICCSIQ